MLGSWSHFNSAVGCPKPAIQFKRAWIAYSSELPFLVITEPKQSKWSESLAVMIGILLSGSEATPLAAA